MMMMLMMVLAVVLQILLLLHATNGQANISSFAPTPAPTACNSYCPLGQFNLDWAQDERDQVCVPENNLRCAVCPSGFFKISGNSWSPCAECGGANRICADGLRKTRSTSLCSYRTESLSRFRKTGLYPPTYTDTEALMGKTTYDEVTVRDAEGQCGEAKLVKSSGLELNIIKPASLVTELEVENVGQLPIRLSNILLPYWITIFDMDQGKEVTTLPNPVVDGLAKAKIYLLVKSSSMKPGDLISTQAGIESISGQISFTSSQLVPGNSASSQTLQTSITVTLSEPSLSLLPTDNSWTINIGTIERKTLALYNMQVKRIDWSASVDYDDETQDWLTLTPNSGSLEQGFKCTRDGEVIGTNGVNKAEIVVLVNGTIMKPGRYSATLNIGHVANQDLYKVVSKINLEVLPGKVVASQSTFSFPNSGIVTERRQLQSNVLSLRLPNTDIEIIPRDSFGISSKQFEVGQQGVFNVSWSNNKTSGTYLIHRNPIDNTFVGALDIFQTGEYDMEIKLEMGNGDEEHIKGSPFKLIALPRSCHEIPNSQPHPETGYTCVCSAGYGKSGESQECKPCPVGQFRDESMLASPAQFCRVCDVGTFQDELGSKTCKFCPDGMQPNPEQTGCSACPDNHVVDKTSQGRNCIPCGPEFTVVNHECVCRPEYYWVEGDGFASSKKCVPCPEGAFCGYGNATTILPKFGYWRASWDPLRFEKCSFPDACLGVQTAEENLLRLPETWQAFQKDPHNYTYYGDSSSLVEVVPPVELLNGCAKEFTGPLCSACAPGYYPIGTGFTCFACDSRARTIGFFFISVVAGLAALTYLIARTIRARGAPRRREVMVLKIVLSHLQVIAMTRRFPLQWPPAIASMFSVFDILSSAGGSALSTHCLFYSGISSPEDDLISSNGNYPLEDFTNNTATADVSYDYGLSDWVFLARSLCYALLPIFMSLLFVLVWRVVIPMYRNTANDALTVREKVIVSNIVLLIVLQPFLTRAGFEFFSCSDDIDGRAFLEAQFTIQCWTGLHQQWIVLGALIITFYAIGIPLYSTVILYFVVRKKPKQFKLFAKLKRKLQSKIVIPQKQSQPTDDNTADDVKVDIIMDGDVEEDVDDSYKDDFNTAKKLQVKKQIELHKIKEEEDALERWRPVYGFIYSGYRKECFYWEIVIMLRKASFATVSVLFRPIGTDIQTYAGVIVLVLSIVAHVKFRPYSEESRLHVIETTSLSICLFTLMCGLFIFSENTSISFKQLLSVLIVMSNIIFLFFVMYSIRETLRDSLRRVAVLLCGENNAIKQFFHKNHQKGKGQQPQQAKDNNNNNNSSNNNSNMDDMMSDDGCGYRSDIDDTASETSCPRSPRERRQIEYDIGKIIDLSFRLQREAERLQRHGEYDAAAVAALKAATTALEALKREQNWDREGYHQFQLQNGNYRKRYSSFSGVRRDEDHHLELPRALSLYEPLPSRTPPQSPEPKQAQVVLVSPKSSSNRNSIYKATPLHDHTTTNPPPVPPPILIPLVQKAPAPSKLLAKIDNT